MSLLLMLWLGDRRSEEHDPGQRSGAERERRVDAGARSRARSPAAAIAMRISVSPIRSPPAGRSSRRGLRRRRAAATCWRSSRVRQRANVLVTAQDLFFSLRPLAEREGASMPWCARPGAAVTIEEGPEEVTIAGRTFHRFAYAAPRSGLHWRILSTDARCHALTFTFTGTDAAALDAAERALRATSRWRRARRRA